MTDFKEVLFQWFINSSEFKKRKVYPSFTDNVLGADFADVELISKLNIGIRFLVCAIVILVNIHGSFLQKINETLQLLILFKKYNMNLIVNQKKYGQINATNFIIDQRNHICRIIIPKCLQRIIKKNLLLLKDLLEF